jgi:hypothetical protein
MGQKMLATREIIVGWPDFLKHLGGPAEPKIISTENPDFCSGTPHFLQLEFHFGKRILCSFLHIFLVNRMKWVGLDYGRRIYEITAF